MGSIIAELWTFMRERKKFCIDRDEYTARGEQLPTAHDEYCNDTQTGFRCCRDVP